MVAWSKLSPDGKCCSLLSKERSECFVGRDPSDRSQLLMYVWTWKGKHPFRSIKYDPFCKIRFDSEV